MVLVMRHRYGDTGPDTVPLYVSRTCCVTPACGDSSDADKDATRYLTYDIYISYIPIATQPMLLNLSIGWG